jgi:hypothetical protein
MGSGFGAIVERTVAKDHVWTDGALGMVVVGRNTGDVQERKDLVFVLQDPCGKALPILVGVDGGSKVEKPSLQPPDAAGKDGTGIDVPLLREAVGVSQESL